jgi:hypothetical protein
MGRCNNRRAQERAQQLAQTPSRARFSKKPPASKKNAVVQKMAQRVAVVAPCAVSTSTTKEPNAKKSNAAKPMLVLSRDAIAKLDEIQLSIESERLIRQQLVALGVIQVEVFGAVESTTNQVQLIKHDDDVMMDENLGLRKNSEKKLDAAATAYYPTQNPMSGSGSFNGSTRTSIQQSYNEYDDDDDDAVVYPPCAAATVQDETEWEGTVNDETTGNDHAVPDDHEVLLRSSFTFHFLTNQLSFDEQQAAQACRAIVNWKGASAAGEQASNKDRHTLSLALDWLALHLSETELKAGFATKSKKAGNTHSEYYNEQTNSDPCDSSCFHFGGYQTDRGCGLDEIGATQSACSWLCSIGIRVRGCCASLGEYRFRWNRHDGCNTRRYDSYNTTNHARTGNNV